MKYILILLLSFFLCACNKDLTKTYTFILKDKAPVTFKSFKHYPNHTIVGYRKDGLLTVRLRDSEVYYVVENINKN
jgi:ABC-type uncharacterized transport system auxiliary subunit